MTEYADKSGEQVRFGRLQNLDPEVTISLNRRSLWVVESLLAHDEERRVVVHSIDGGGRYIDCGIEAQGGLITGIELARICLGDLAQVAIVTWRGGGPRGHARTSRHRSPGARLSGRPVRRLGLERRKVLRDGFRSDASGGRRGGNLRCDRPSRRGQRRRRRARDSQAAHAGDRGQNRRRRAESNPRTSPCWSPPRPAWPAAFRSWLARSRPPCTSWPS